MLLIRLSLRRIEGDFDLVSCITLKDAWLNANASGLFRYVC